MDSSIYDENYFLYGKQSGKSLYEDYRWLPQLTIPMCQHVVQHCGMEYQDRILDFGCARGYTVKALRALGYNASGVDVSEWAIANADQETKPYLRLAKNGDHRYLISEPKFDWIIAKDVLEHVEYVHHIITDLMTASAKGLFVVVPLSKFKNGSYVIDEYEKDITHKQRWPLHKWVEMFVRPGWSVEASYRVYGVKDNYYKPGWEYGNGFITCRRIDG